MPLTFPVYFLSAAVARILDFLTGLTETLTEKAASLPLSTIENIGMTSFECIILTITIFLFTQSALNRKSLSILYPLGALLCLVLTGTLRDISTRRSSELIVYNSIGYTNIGIRTGRILNIYSDTIMKTPEVNRHASALRLKIKTNIIKDYPIQIKSGTKKILITEYLNKSLVLNSLPDFVILNGKSGIGYDLQSGKRPGLLIMGSNSRKIYQPSELCRLTGYDSVYFVRKDGAFSLKL